jgi:hypothetical protein
MVGLCAQQRWSVGSNIAIATLHIVTLCVGISAAFSGC